MRSMVSMASGSKKKNRSPTGHRREGTKKEAIYIASLLDPGSYLFFQTVASQVSSAYESLTSVFGMGTGGTSQLNHRKIVVLKHLENCIQ